MKLTLFSWSQTSADDRHPDHSIIQRLKAENAARSTLVLSFLLQLC